MPIESTQSGTLFVNIVAAKNLKDNDTVGDSDAFCEVTLSKNANCAKLIKTKTVDDSLNPWWEHHDSFNLNLPLKELHDINMLFKVYDYDYNSNDLLGKLVLELDELLRNPGGWINQLFTLWNDAGEALDSEIYIQVQWRPHQQPDIDMGLRQYKIEAPPLKENREKIQKPVTDPNQLTGNPIYFLCQFFAICIIRILT